MTRRDDKPAPEGGARTRKTPEQERKKWDPANYGDPGEGVEKDVRAAGRPSTDD